MTPESAEHRDALFDGVPYTYGAVVPAASMLFTAGACPLSPEGDIVGLGHPMTQATVAVENLIAALARFGAEPKHLVKTTIYVVGDQDDLSSVWNVIAERLAPFRPPSTLVGVTVLGYGGQLVEIEGIAALPGTEESGPA